MEPLHRLLWRRNADVSCKINDGCVDMQQEFGYMYSRVQTEIYNIYYNRKYYRQPEHFVHRDTNCLLNNFLLLIIPEAIIAGATCIVSGAATPQLENSSMGKRLRHTDTHSARIVGSQCQPHNAIQDLQGYTLHLVACDHILPAARASIMAL